MAKKTKRKSLVFISHISAEKEVAVEFKSLIETHFLGLIEVFVSSDEHTISLGERWLDSISDGLRRCVVEIVVCSPMSVTRPWIQFEAGAGWVREVPVIPLCHSGMTPGELPIPLNMLQGITVTDEPGLKRIFAKLSEAIEARTPDVDFKEFVRKMTEFEVRHSACLDIRKIYDKSSDVQADLATFISGSKRKILLCGLHFNVSLSDRRADYLKALNSGVDLTICVLNPESRAVEATADAFGMDLEELRSECTTSSHILKSLWKEARKSRPAAGTSGTLTLTVTSRMPRARYYLFDHDLPSGVVLCTPYVDGLRSSHTPSFAFRTSAAVAKTYVESCVQIMAQSVPMEGLEAP